MLFPIIKYTVVGRSMEPTFQEGIDVLACQTEYYFTRPKVGDVIIFRHPQTKKHLIKRIQKIANKRIFVTGDNADRSSDSRSFGWIEKSDVVARVFYQLG